MVLLSVCQFTPGGGGTRPCPSERGAHPPVKVRSQVRMGGGGGVSRVPPSMSGPRSGPGRGQGGGGGIPLSKSGPRSGLGRQGVGEGRDTQVPGHAGGWGEDGYLGGRPHPAQVRGQDKGGGGKEDGYLCCSSWGTPHPDLGPDLDWGAVPQPEQHSMYLLCSGQYATCVHAGGFSCVWMCLVTGCPLLSPVSFILYSHAFFLENYPNNSQTPGWGRGAQHRPNFFTLFQLSRKLAKYYDHTRPRGSTNVPPVRSSPSLLSLTL